METGAAKTAPMSVAAQPDEALSTGSSAVNTSPVHKFPGQRIDCGQGWVTSRRAGQPGLSKGNRQRFWPGTEVGESDPRWIGLCLPGAKQFADSRSRLRIRPAPHRAIGQRPNISSIGRCLSSVRRIGISSDGHTVPIRLGRSAIQKPATATVAVFRASASASTLS
jgi:hypothetical protein